MELDRLPDDCIFALLKPNFSLTKLIRLRAVSKKWKEIVEKICLSKTELNLFDSLLDMVSVYKNADPYGLMKRSELRRLAWNLLIPSKICFESDITNFFARLFPNVTKLVCFLDNDFQVDLLLQCWSRSLEDVTIICMLHAKQVTQHFWRSLDSMPKLKRLVFHDISDTTFSEVHQLVPYVYFVPPTVTVFKQLEYFAMTVRTNQVYDIFDYKKPEPRTRQTVAVPQEHQNRAMAASLTHLVLAHGSISHSTPAQPAVIKAILASTKALRHLDICDLDFNLTDLMPEMMLKTNLESIRIKSNQLVPGDGVMRPTIRLNSVKRLHLVATKVANLADTKYRLLPVLFPSLEHFEVATEDAKLMELIKGIMPRSVVLSFISNN